MRQSNLLAIGGFLLLQLAIGPALSCIFVPSSSSGHSPVFGGSSPSQYVLPPIPAAKPGVTCGHSMYYSNSNKPGADIIGGIIAAKYEYPWLVRLQIDLGNGKSDLCGASLVDESWLVTAGHCAKAIVNVSNVLAVFADWDKQNPDPDDNKYSALISKVVIHAKFNPASYDNDIAMLKLQVPVSTTVDWYTQKICLPSTCSDGCEGGTTAYIAGWGTTFEGTTATSSQYLRKAYIKIQTAYECKDAYSGIADVTDNMICAGWPNGGVDSCLGDSGGPLMTAENGYYKLCGITSFGKGCGQVGYYGIYTKVCKYTDWIKSTIATS